MSTSFTWQKEARRSMSVLKAERHYWLEDDKGRVLVKTIRSGAKYAFSVLFPTKQYRASAEKFDDLDSAYRAAASWWTRNKNAHTARFAAYSLNFYK